MPLAAGVCNSLVVLPVPPALTNLPEVVVFQYLCLVVSQPFPTEDFGRRKSIRTELRR